MDKGVLLPYFNKLELQERWKLKKYQKYTILMIELVFQLYNGKYWVDIKICLSKTIESISEKLIIQISVSCSVDHQIQFLSSQHMKVLKEQPWHRLQLEHISPSAQVPYLNCQIITIFDPQAMSLPGVFPSTHLARALQTDGVTTGVFGCAVVAPRLAGGLGSRAGGGQGVPSSLVQADQADHHHHRHHHPHPGSHVWG